MFVIICGLLLYIKKRDNHEAYLISKKVESTLELKRTMAMGLSYRFNFPTEKDEDGETVFKKATELFLKEDYFDFEEFVAEVVSKKLGGMTYTTVKSGDFGVDFRHEREDGLYLGQVKVRESDLGFEPIALIHSNMEKEGAKGGYVITTADFTPSARTYAKGLNIKLINGIELVTFWLDSMDSKVYEFNEKIV